MANIDEKAVNMNVLKGKVKALNESGLLPTPIPIKGKKMELAAAFVKGLEKCNEIGKLDDVPDEVYNYYTAIVPPPDGAEEPAADPTPDTNAAPATTAPATGRGRTAGRKAAPAASTKAPAAAKKATRADVFAELVTHKTPYTKEQLVDKMVAKYGGSEAEASFQIGQMTRTVLALAGKGLLAAEVNDKKQLVVG